MSRRYRGKILSAGRSAVQAARTIYNRIPNLIVTPTFHSKRFRYQVTAGGGSGTYNIGISDLLDQWFIATATNGGYRVANAIRLRKIEIWSQDDQTPGQFQGYPCAFSWDTNGNLGAPSREIIGQGGTKGFDLVHIVERPPKGSQADQWLSAATAGTGVNLFNVYLVAGSIMELTMDYSMPEGTVFAGNTPVLVQSVIAGATVGRYYVRGFPIGGATLVPIGWDSI